MQDFQAVSYTHLDVYKRQRQIAGISGKLVGGFDNKIIFTMAADHGVTDEKISAYPKEVTPQMVKNFLNGKAAINVLANHIGARVMVVDMGVNYDFEEHPFLINKKIGYGTRNMAKGSAMTREEAILSIPVSYTHLDVYKRQTLPGPTSINTSTPCPII